MKHLKWAVAGFVLAMVPIFAWVSIAQAQKFSNNIEKGHTVDSSLYSSGKTVDINGTINGDVFCAGQTVNIDAVVHGDVICAGQDVTISGKVDGNVRVAGQTVTIEAEVGRSATAAAMAFSLDAHAKIGQDLTASGDTLNVKGSVGRDVVASGSSVTLNGQVGRNAKADGNKVRLKSEAAIAGNLHYTSTKKVELASGAEIKGKTQHTTPEKSGNGPFSDLSFNLGFYLFMLFGLLFVGLALAYLFPNFLRKQSDYMNDNFAKTLIVGLAASLLIPMLALGLVVSIVGIPFTFFLFAGWVFAAMLSGPISAYYLGRRIFRQKPKNPMLIMLVGGAVLTTMYFFPLAGIFFLMLSYWLGFGSILLSIQAHIRPDQTEEVEKKASKAKGSKKK